MRVAVIGAGVVGLTTGAALATVGHDVVLVETDAIRATMIAAGLAPFEEPGLSSLLQDTMAVGRLRITARAPDAVQGAHVVLICVGTPSNESGADLSFLRAAACEVGSSLRGGVGYRAVAVKSTVPPGSTTGVFEPLLREVAGLPTEELGVAVNPEFLRGGSAVEDALHPDRIVVGSSDSRTRQCLEELYASFHAPVMHMTTTGAEMAKYCCNAVLATLASLGNELAALCEVVDGADAVDVLRVVHADRRFRSPSDGSSAPASITSYLVPGLGFGGSCLPKDTFALATWARSVGATTPILDAIRVVNADRPQHVVNVLRQRLNIRGATVAVLGLSFKPGTSDLRGSRAIELAQLLSAAGANLQACDPVASSEASELLNGARVGADVATTITGADAMILATPWPEYRGLSPDVVRTLMRRPLVIDVWRVLDGRAWSGPCEYVPMGVKAHSDAAS